MKIHLPHSLPRYIAPIFLILLLTACKNATNTPLPPTPTSVPVITKTTAPPPTATIPPLQPTETPTAPPAASVRGFAVFDRQQGKVLGYELGSKAELFNYPIPGSTYFTPGQIQLVGETLFYFSMQDQAVHEINQKIAATLNFLPKDVALGFAVSTDGKQIAWGTDIQGQKNPGSELWVTNVDGSSAMKIASIDPTANSKWLVLRPFKWLDDGRLLFIYVPTGIGGYILFNGFAGISVYDPSAANQAVTPLLAPDAPGSGILCVNGVSPDLKVAVTTCGSQTQGQIILRDLSSDKLTAIPMLPEQGQAGSIFYSPSGEWLAYAVARGNRDDEAGKAAVVSSAGGEPQVIASFSGGYVQVAGWIDEDTLLLQTYQNDLASLWEVRRDGSALSKLADGIFIGVIK
jgi:Tol biopolymer transport system component